ncbi:hypothetical protein NADFUDRAFT_45195 [Nadsonia fulvescens var. elongata DSM 6958]|uniref:Ribosomal protein bL31m N-terminal domain-containing protein n=1 Tax=Nadsonia fulvescens var. elongata DSM 6958 TaxID=857566 RepID=A0A1E3PNE4_9ASCO|nr:hypothetical protein NADFUDRAFT_45195 [Nadsonia fulvescens var. elongata DSM 6958]
MLSVKLITRPSTLSAAVPTLVRNAGYQPASTANMLPRRVSRKLQPGKTRVPIYYQFDCTVELSDGSTIVRRQQYPKTEWRYLQDQRNNALWNPSKSELKDVSADLTGKMAKFNKKYGMTAVPATSTAPAESVKADTTTTTKSESTPAPAAPAEDAFIDDFMDLLDVGAVNIKTGKIAGKVRKKK